MIDQVRREINRALAGVRQALRGMLSTLSLSTRIQRANGEGLAGEALADMELFQHFGFTSAPPAGTQLIVLPLGGRTSAAVVVATEHGAFRFRLGAAGEAAIYNQWGDVIHLRQDRTIHVRAQALVQVQAPEATFSGNVAIAGNVSIAGSLAVNGAAVTHGGINIGKTHTHGGVDTGPSNTGAPN